MENNMKVGEIPAESKECSFRGKRAIYDDFRDELFTLLRNLDDDKVLVIKNVDEKYENAIRCAITKPSFFAKSVGKVFSVSCRSDRIAYISIVDKQNSFDASKTLSKLENEQLTRIRDKFYRQGRYEIAESLEDFVVGYSEIDEN